MIKIKKVYKSKLFPPMMNKLDFKNVYLMRIK